MAMFNKVTKTFQWGQHSVTMETGEIARQASGAVLVNMDDTVVLATVVASKSAKPGQDFFPLTVDYIEKTYAAGKIPGSFFKREAKPSEHETLTSRLIDRPIRPLFPEVHVVAYDFGAKRNILRMLVDRGCRLTIVPAQTSAEDVLKMNPDGIFLSNGPGDPAPCDYAITAIQKFLETDIPVFGICLGHQLLALASGAKTVKMKFGHHGGNHPVKDVEKNVVMITAQNHGFAVDEATLPANLRVTHKSLFDGTLQGIHRTDKPAFSFQGHPEASPGPHDAAPLFDHFIELIEQYRKTAK